MFDSHCHLTDLDDPVGGLVQAQAAGVRSVLTCAHSAESNAAVVRLRDQVGDLPIALGLHPWNANEDLDQVIRGIRSSQPDAIGEIGLDGSHDPPIHSLERQMRVLEAQLDLAVEMELPVSLHSRKAIDLLLSAIRNHPGVRGVLHAFSGSHKQVVPFLELGFFVGIGGAVTRTRAERLRRLAVQAPIESILLETDAPAIGMDGVEPPDVRPSHLAQVAAALAELRGLDVAQIERQTDVNAVACLGPAAGRTPRLRSPL